MMSENSNLG